MEHLFRKLQCYGNNDIYPYHMPGHKRQIAGELPKELYKMDITEIEGFDNLHQPEGILLELQKKAALLYGAEESFYLVNGSTAGILSAISAAIPFGGHILMARNCHKSAYHAAYLRKLKISYLYPTMLDDFDIYEAVTPEQIRSALEKEADIDGVLVVSPTYEGRIADIRGIAEVVHEKGIPLIVDEAHGAHLGLSMEVHENSCQAGADIVVQSVHKTLPALTQTALLHVNSNRINRDLLKRFLHIYQTSSPSYLLMASIDNALCFAEKNGKTAFAEFRHQYEEMLEKLSQCDHLRYLQSNDQKQDIGKLVISVKNADITGKQLYNMLLQKYHLQTEMATESYVLAMFTVADSREGYNRMTEALLEIDRGLAPQTESEKKKKKYDFGVSGKEREEDILPLSEAWDAEREEILLDEAAGRYAGEFVSLYPPGVPILVPGEKITEELSHRVLRWWEQGLTVHGIEKRKEKHLIQVLKDKNGR